MCSRLINSILVVISFSVTLAIIEIALRLTGSYAPPHEPIQAVQPWLYQADETIGYRLWPSRKASHLHTGSNPDPIWLISNSDGFRSSRELDEPDPRQRILVVGDSFVFGLGVREEDRLTEQLEILAPQWRVDNMGITGWGLDLMIRAIEQYGKKAHPDVVVLALYTDDFRRLLPYYAGMGFAYPKFEFKGSDLITVAFPYFSPWERLRFVQLLYRARWKLNRNRYDLNGALLDRFLKDAEIIGFKPVVVFIPAEGDYKEDKARRGFLHGWTTRNAVPYLDLTNAIQAAGADSFYLKNNVHWNPAGHRIAAEELHRVLSGLTSLTSE